MKIDFDAFLKNPGTASLILIYGPDSGLVSERAIVLIKSTIGSTDDPFRYAEITDPKNLLEEATAASLTGGRRVIRLRDAGDDAAKAAERLLKQPVESLVILEAGDLTAKSKLLALAENNPAAAAINCRAVDAARLPGIIAGRLRALSVTIEPEAAAWVAGNITGEEAAIRQAVELLYLYAGTDGSLDLRDVSAALADGGETSIQDAIDAALAGNPAALDRAVSLAYDEGVSPVALIRVLLAELMRLRVAKSQIGNGASVEEAMRQLRPPVFFKRAPAFTRALTLWPLPAIDQAIKTGLTAEQACKSTHTPDQAYCRQMLLGLAAKARLSAPRGR